MNRRFVPQALLAALALSIAGTASAQDAQVTVPVPGGYGQVQVQGPYQQQQQYPQQQYQQQQYQQPQYQQYPQQQYAQPQRQGRTVTRPNLGLTISGAVMLGVSWIIHAALVSPFAGYSLSDGYQPEWNDVRWTGVIPLAGPWIQLAILPTGLGEDAWSPYLVIDGLLQVGGLTLLILGLTLQETRTEYASNDQPSFAIIPTAGQNGAGLAAIGTF